MGLAVAATYIFGYRVLPGIVLGSFLLGVHHNALLLAVLLAVAQVIQPIVDVRILRALNFDPRLERVRDPVIICVIAGPLGSLLAAAAAVTLYAAFGARTSAQLPLE